MSKIDDIRREIEIEYQVIADAKFAIGELEKKIAELEAAKKLAKKEALRYAEIMGFDPPNQVVDGYAGGD